MIIRFALFQCVWLCCAFGAVWGMPLIGISAALALVGACVVTDAVPRRAFLLQVPVAAIAFLGESALVAGGFVAYASPWPSRDLAPAWIVALWMAFGTTLRDTSALLGTRAKSLAGLLGFLLAPASYLGAERMGAVIFEKPILHTWLAIGILWAMAYPTLLALDERIHPRAPLA